MWGKVFKKVQVYYNSKYHCISCGVIMLGKHPTYLPITTTIRTKHWHRTTKHLLTFVTIQPTLVEISKRFDTANFISVTVGNWCRDKHDFALYMGAYYVASIPTFRSPFDGVDFEKCFINLSVPVQCLWSMTTAWYLSIARHIKYVLNLSLSTFGPDQWISHFSKFWCLGPTIFNSSLCST